MKKKQKVSGKLPIFSQFWRCAFASAMLFIACNHAFAWSWGDTSRYWAVSGEIRSSPALARDGSIIVGNSLGELYSFKPDGTQTNFVSYTGGAIYSSPVIGPGGTIYVGSSDNKLYSFLSDGTTGHIWAVSDRIHMSSPAVEGANGTVYVGSEDRNLYAFDISDGTTSHFWTTSGEIQSSPAIAPDGTIYVGSTDGRLYSFNSVSNVWQTSGAIWSSPAIGSEGIVYIGSLDGNLYAFNQNGSTSRVWNTTGPIYSSPVIGSDGVIYIGSSDSKFYAFNPDGTTNHVWDTNGGIEAAAALGSDGTIYVGTVNGYFYAFAPDGTTNLKWMTEGKILSSPSICATGTIYIGSSDGNLYAFNGTGGTLEESTWPKFRQNQYNTGFMFSGPTNVSCTDEITDKVEITWDAPIDIGGATGYEIWRNESNDIISATNVGVSITLDHNDSTASNGITYYYWVRATNDAWISRFSAPDYGHRAITNAPASPTNITASAGDFAAIALSWHAASNAAGYEIWRNLSGDFSESSNIVVNIDSTNYNDSANALGYTYYYWIRATNEFGSSGFSKPSVSGYRDLAPPTGVMATTGAQGEPSDRVQIQWNANSVPSADRFVIFRNTDNTPATASVIGDVSESNIYNDNSAEYGKIYYYWVKSMIGTYTGMVFSASDFGYYGGATSRLWQVSRKVGGVAIGTNGVIYMGVGESDAVFYGFNPDGTTNRVWNLGSNIGKAPAIGEDGTIYVPGGWDNKLYGLNPNNGTISNTWSLSGAMLAPPAIGSNGVIYAGSYDGKLYAFNTNGMTNFVFLNGGSDLSPVIAADGTVYSARGTSLYAFNPNGTTSHIWTIESGGFSASPAIGSDGAIYASSHGGKLYAFNPDGTTSRVWRATGDSYSMSPPVIGANDTIYVGSDNCNLYAFNPNGTTSRVWMADGPIRASPVIGSDGIIYAGADGGTFYAFNANGTTNRFWTPSNPEYTSPTIGNNGIVYMGVNSETEGKLYAYYGTGGTLGATSWPKSGHDNRNTSRDSSAPAVPVAPGGVTASKGASTNVISINWNSAIRATSYEIYINISNHSETASFLAEVSNGTAYSDTNAERIPLYYYWIKAKNSIGTSGFSAHDSGCLSVPPPDGVSASDGAYTDRISLAWNPVTPHSGSIRYEVWRGADNNPDAAQPVNKNVLQESYNDFGITAGSIYYYWIKAKDAYGTSETSVAANGYRALNAPEGVSATDGDFTNRVQVTWNPVYGAFGYEIARNTNDALEFATLVAGTEGTFFNDLSVQAMVVYYYWVRATNEVDSGSFSAVVSGYSKHGSPPAAPSYVSASKGTYTNKIVVAWDSVQNAEGYQVWRYTSDAPASSTKLSSLSDTMYEDFTTQANRIYYYWIRATNTAGRSAFSTPDFGFSGLPPDPPSSVSATDGKYMDQIVVTWDQVPDAENYQVWRHTTDNPAEAKKIGKTSTSSYNDTSVAGRVIYYYWITATNFLGTSQFSKSDSGYIRTPYVINDYDGDGKSDLAVYDTRNGHWFIYSATNDIIAWQKEWGWPGAVPVPGDYTGNGRNDLMLFDTTNGFWHINSLERTLDADPVAWGWPGAEPVPGDYNGDGRTDLAVFDENTGNWFILALDGSILLWEFAWGGPGAVPVPGDYNGDGRTDLAVFDENTGNWFILALDGSLVAWEFAWGWPGAVPVPGDYNGDGRSDLAVFDENTATWFILASDGSLIAWALQWGVPDGIPMSGDYTGDGISELAVFDIHTGDWHVMSLDGQLAVIQAWGWPGAMPVAPGILRRYNLDIDEPIAHSAIGSWNTAADEIFNIIADGTVSGKDSQERSFSGTWSASSDTTISFSIYRDGGSYKNPFTLEVLTESTGKITNADGVSAKLTRR